jgi:hypothetical protein
MYCLALSDMSSIRVGVPQGVVAAPLLFNLYTSDQPTTNLTNACEFFDDKAILTLHHDPLEASNRIQTHLDILSAWYKEWGFKLNVSKSIHCTFTLRPINYSSITLNNQSLPTTQNVRYLGLYLDH